MEEGWREDEVVRGERFMSIGGESREDFVDVEGREECARWWER